MPNPTPGIAILEMLVSRLCHDLAGPVGAVCNGVELLQEMPSPDGADLNAEALALIDDSARTASARLSLFRLALGTAGGQPGLTEAAAIRSVADWLNGRRLTLTWPAGTLTGTLAGTLLQPGLLKLVLLCILLAEEAMPAGGNVTVGVSGRAVELAANGPRILPIMAGQDGSVGDTESALTPRSILTWVSAAMAAHYGFDLMVRQRMPTGLVFALTVKA